VPDLVLVSRIHEMADHVIIKSAQDGSALELLDATRAGTFRARLRGRGFDGAVEVYVLEPPAHLAG
jgi:hypothetical protein